MTEKEEAALLASVQGMIDGLPSVEEVRGLTLEEQGAVYNTALVELWKVYDALTAEQQGKLNTDRKAALEEYFTTLVATTMQIFVQPSTGNATDDEQNKITLEVQSADPIEAVKAKVFEKRVLPWLIRD